MKSIFIVESSRFGTVEERTAWPDARSAHEHQRWMKENQPSQRHRVIVVDAGGRLVPSVAYLTAREIRRKEREAASAT